MLNSSITSPFNCKCVCVCVCVCVYSTCWHNQKCQRSPGNILTETWYSSFLMQTIRLFPIQAKALGVSGKLKPSWGIGSEVLWQSYDKFKDGYTMLKTNMYILPVYTCKPTSSTTCNYRLQLCLCWFSQHNMCTLSIMWEYLVKKYSIILHCLVSFPDHVKLPVITIQLKALVALVELINLYWQAYFEPQAPKPFNLHHKHEVQVNPLPHVNHRARGGHGQVSWVTYTSSVEFFDPDWIPLALVHVYIVYIIACQFCLWLNHWYIVRHTLLLLCIRTCAVSRKRKGERGGEEGRDRKKEGERGGEERREVGREGRIERRSRKEGWYFYIYNSESTPLILKHLQPLPSCHTYPQLLPEATVAS